VVEVLQGIVLQGEISQYNDSALNVPLRILERRATQIDVTLIAVGRD